MNHLKNSAGGPGFHSLLKPAGDRILLFGLCIGLFFILVFGYLSNQYMKTVEEQRLMDLKQKVQVARNTIAPIVDAHGTGRISSDEALSRIRDLVRRMVYDDHNGPNYIFMSSYEGIMLVQPFEPAKEMSDVLGLKDSYGVFIIQELIKTAQSVKQKGYVTYHYKTPHSTVPQEKISYVVGIPELSCYIGTGAYMEDLRIKETRFLYGTAGLVTVLLVMLFLLISFSKKEIMTRNLKLRKENDDHKQTEKKLMESEARYRMLIENANDAIFYFGFREDGQPGRFLDVNAVACKMYGYERKEFLEISPAELEAGEENGIPPGNAPLNFAPDRDRVFEMRHKSKSGKSIPVEISMSRIETGEGLFAVIVARDMTERNQRESALRLNRFSTENASLGIFWLNGLAPILYANKQACRSLGYSLEELKGMHAWDIDTTLTEEAAALFLEEIRGKKNITVERTLSHRNGTVFPVSITMEYAEYDGRELIIAYTQDITERKRAERELRLTQYAVDHSATPIIRFSPDASVAYANKAAGAQLGYSREELTAMSIPDFDPLWTREFWDSRGLAMLREQRISTFETVNRRKDGVRFPVEVLCYETEFEGEEYFHAFITDITERKSSEKRHLQSRKMEALGTLAGGIAHDFNNILSGIFGYTQMTARLTAKIPKAQQYLNQVNAAGERAAALVQQILTFSRNDKSQMKPLDMAVVVKETLKLMRASLPADIEIRNEMPENGGTILADPTQIHQVVMNLCTNAYHAMADTGGVLRIELAPVVLDSRDMVNYDDIPEGRYLELTVSDNGEGIAPHILSRIFEPYYTTKEPGAGTGMGLSTVHGIVRNHGGAVSVYSEVGVGTTFKVLFPMTEKEEIREMELALPLPGGSERLLFVDDENALVEFAGEFLSGLGYSVEAFTDPLSALEVFRAAPDDFHMVISDLTMPGMTGDRLARKVKKIRPDIPVIICTGFSSSMVSENHKEAGIDHVLMKPLNIHELSNEIRKVLDKGD